MKYCAQCGSELYEGANFCSACGAPTGNSSAAAAGKTVKCPQCGELIDAFVAKCPACGYELRGSQTLSRVRELEDALESVESPKKRSELIRNFYIPNTKEDILEFVILATSNLKAGGSDDAAWEAKLEQAIQKAELVFDEGPQLEKLREQCKAVSSSSYLKRVASGALHSRLVQGLVLIGIGTIMVIFGEQDYSFLMLIGMFPIGLGVNLIMSTLREG